MRVGAALKQLLALGDPVAVANRTTTAIDGDFGQTLTLGELVVDNLSVWRGIGRV